MGKIRVSVFSPARENWIIKSVANGFANIEIVSNYFAKITQNSIPCLNEIFLHLMTPFQPEYILVNAFSSGFDRAGIYGNWRPRVIEISEDFEVYFQRHGNNPPIPWVHTAREN